MTWREFGLLFQQELNRCGRLCETAALESPQQNLLVERHGGILGEILAILLEAHQIAEVPDIKLACAVPCAAKNGRPTFTRYGASQRAFARCRHAVSHAQVLLLGVTWNSIVLGIARADEICEERPAQGVYEEANKCMRRPTTGFSRCCNLKGRSHSVMRER
eukprot:1643585-Amphidinium_carterae.1